MRKSKKLNRLSFNNKLTFFSFLLLIIVLPIAILASQQTTRSRSDADEADSSLLNRYEKKYLLLVFDPIMPSGKGSIEEFGWNDPADLTSQYVNAINQVSHGTITYTQAERVDSTEFLEKSDGFTYTPEQYFECVTNPSHEACHSPDIINYQKMMENYHICDKVNSGEIDEVFMFAGPWQGFYEAVQAGTGAIETNGPVITGTSCNRIVDIMGFNPERTLSEMLEDMGHRVEGTMRHIYGTGDSTWKTFSTYDQIAPDQAVCGNVHFAPNSTSDYDWSNPRTVTSQCKDWRDNYPNLTGATEQVYCENWNCQSVDYHTMWLTSLPHIPGIAPDGKKGNWWEYIVNLDGLSTPLPTPTPTPDPTLEPTPTPSPEPTPEPTPIPTPDNSCKSEAPKSAPDIYQINFINNKVTIYFAPAKPPFTKYFIEYGENGQMQHSTIINSSYTAGATSVVINSLKPDTIYGFRIQALNDCMPSGWSNNLSGSTTKSSTLTRIVYKNGQPKFIDTSPKNLPNPTLKPAVRPTIKPSPTVTSPTAKPTLTQAQTPTPNPLTTENAINPDKPLNIVQKIIRWIRNFLSI